MLKNGNNLFYLACIISTVAAYFINVGDYVVLSVIVTLIGTVISAIDIKKGCVFFFIMALAFSDFTYEGVLDADNEATFGGIYMANLGGGTIMVFWAIINFGLIFVHKGNWASQRLKENKIFLVLVISFFASIVGFACNITTTANLVLQTAVSDVRLYVNVFLGFLTLLIIVRKMSDLVKYFNAFILILLTQIIIVIVSSYNISQVKTIYTFFSGTETYLIGIMMLYFLFLLKQHKKQFNTQAPKLLLIIGLFIVILFLFIVPSRGRIIALLFAMLLYLIYSQKWQYAIVAPIFIVLAIYVVQIINPNFYNAFLFKISTFDPDAEGADSSKVRYIEAVNILGELFTNPYYLVFGKGFGGYFGTEFMSYRGIPLGVGSYSPAWIAEGKFYKPHGTWLFLLLKNGFIMACTFYYYVFNMLVKGWRFFKKAPQSIYKIIGLCVLFILPYVSVIMFSSKLQIMFGMLVAFSYLAIRFAIMDAQNKLSQQIVNIQPNDPELAN
jgi:hypothetical protein